MVQTSGSAQGASKPYPRIQISTEWSWGGLYLEIRQSYTPFIKSTNPELSLCKGHLMSPSSPPPPPNVQPRCQSRAW